MRGRLIFVMLITLTLIAVAAPRGRAATYDSGSTGINGAFPPSPPATPYNIMELDLQTGVVRYYNNTTLVSTVPVPPGTGGFPTGILNFTTIQVRSGETLKFVRNAANTPVVFLAQGDVTIAGTVNLDGQPGRPASDGTPTGPSGGAGGPGGFDGGAGGGAGTVAAGIGLGPGGGAGGAASIFCSGGGGGFGIAGYAALAQACGTAGGPPYGNSQLLPLIGGSGGGGGAEQVGYRGAGGGGGGGAILIASSGTITLIPGGFITASGGNGGSGNDPGYSWGGGGSGGAVRLVATTLAGAASISLSGGAGRSPMTNEGRGGYGRIRLEAFNSTLVVYMPGPGVPSSIGPPGIVMAISLPTLRITTVGGQTVPLTPTGAFATPDVTLPTAATTPVRVVVTATNIPAGTQVFLRAKPVTGPITSVTTPGLSGGTAQADLPMELTQPNIIGAEATIILSGWFGSPIKYAGEDVMTATVTASLGGPSQVRYLTKSGREVPADALAMLGLPR